MSSPSFIVELQRRRVFRAMVAYGVVTFGALQIIEPIMHAYHWPDAVLTWLVTGFAAGFPVVVGLAWIFDVNQGRVERTVPSARLRGMPLLAVLIGIGLLAAAPGVLWYFFLRPGARASSGAAAAKGVEEAARGADVERTPSIAVLPFENLSDDKANAYFAAGIQDEILTRLAKIGAISVVSRTSTARFASSPGNLPEIARLLGVANILEGSVQKAGDSVHINVQLIRAATDKHLWAEIYNRKLDDIFAVEGEVAGAIAAALNAQLTGAEKQQLAAKPTLSAAAYDAYLHGLEAQNSVFSPQNVKAASAYFAQAARLDPAFALAWAHGSDVDGAIYFDDIDHSPERIAAARRGAELAMRLQPDLPESWAAKGLYAYHTQDYDGAEVALEEARKRQRANTADILFAIARVDRRRGDYARSNEKLEQVIKLDPGNIVALDAWQETLTSLGQTARSRQVIDRELIFRPQDPDILISKAQAWLAEGDLDAAGRLLDGLAPRLANPYALLEQAQSLVLRRDYAKLISMMTSALAAPGFELDGYGSGVYPVLGWAERRAGDEKAAQATFKEGLARIEVLRKSWGDGAGWLPLNAALIRAGLGDGDGAERDARRALELAGKDQFVRDLVELVIPNVQALAGRNDQALTNLERLAKKPFRPPFGDLKFNPDWDGLRGDPRFERLVEGAKAAQLAQPGP